MLAIDLGRALQCQVRTPFGSCHALKTGHTVERLLSCADHPWIMVGFLSVGGYSGEHDEPAMTETQPRRLAAILAADIAGYSALMGADEERTVRDLKGHQAVLLPMIGEHGGRIIDTAGDGILAEFPSVMNSIKCALA